jgi:hypothetical protein
MRRAFAFAAVALAVAVGALVTPAVAPVSPVDAVTPPTHQIALGFSSLPYDDMNNVDAHTAAYGRAPAIWSVWSDWGRVSGQFPKTTLDGLRARGIVPTIFWEPVIPGQPDFLWSNVLSGQYDTYIQNYAQAAKDWGGTIILRFAHEMDGVWFPWGTGHGNNTSALFVAGWRHVWNIFRGPGGVGATNVKFLWSPTVPKAAFFPGDKYTDFVGFSAFNWAKHGKWFSMGTLLNIRAGRMRKITKKPEIVAELGSNSIGGNKAAWLTNGYANTYNKYPYIVAINYFDINMLPSGQPDWRLVTPPAAATAYAKIVSNPNFQGTLVMPRASIGLPAAVVTSTPDPVTVNLTFTTSDANGSGITRYFVSSSSTPPLASDPNWTTTKPTSFTLPAGYGQKTVYAWVQDRNGIISPTAQATAARFTTTTTSVTSDIHPSTFHQGVTFTATITSGGGTVNSGTVDFKSDGVDIVGCSAQPVASNGTATCGPITGLSAGSHPITAYFSGATIFAASNGAMSPSQTVHQATTSTSVQADNNPSTFGQGVTFTAKVTSTAGNPAGGTVEFQSDAADIPGCHAQPVSAGVATCGPISNLTSSSSSYNITVYFSGSTNFAESNNEGSAYQQNVSQASTTTSVAADVNPSTYGDTVTFTASVSSSTGPTVNEGMVQFQSDGSDIADCDSEAVSVGAATCTTSALDAGPHNITAYFTDVGGNFANSNTGSPLSQTVNQAQTTTSVGSDKTPSDPGDTVTFTATISSGAGTVNVGNVDFRIDANDIAECTTQPVSSSGVATCTTVSASLLTSGPHNITAYFSGSTDFAASDNSGSPYQQGVN